MITADSIDEVAVAKRLNLLEACGLQPDEAPWVRLDAGSLPRLDMFMWDGILFADPTLKPYTRASYLRQTEVNHSALRLIESAMEAKRPFFALGATFSLIGDILGKTWQCHTRSVPQEVSLRKTPAGKLDPLLTDLDFYLRADLHYHVSEPTAHEALSVLAISEEHSAQVVRLDDAGYFTAADLPDSLPRQAQVSSISDLLLSFTNAFGGSDDAA